MKFYAGIGSRQTPPEILNTMEILASALEDLGWTLRSGGATGADSAFERGVRNHQMKEIWIPWNGFNGRSSIHLPTPEAFELAAKYHPAWDRCSQGAKSLHARNVHQIFGEGLAHPVKFVVCWTTDGLASGGTGQAIRIAEAFQLPVYNLQRSDHLKRVTEFLS